MGGRRFEWSTVGRGVCTVFRFHANGFQKPLENVERDLIYALIKPLLLLLREGKIGR